MEEFLEMLSLLKKNLWQDIKKIGKGYLLLVATIFVVSAIPFYIAMLSGIYWKIHWLVVAAGIWRAATAVALRTVLIPSRAVIDGLSGELKGTFKRQLEGIKYTYVAELCITLIILIFLDTIHDYRQFLSIILISMLIISALGTSIFNKRIVLPAIGIILGGTIIFMIYLAAMKLNSTAPQQSSTAYPASNTTSSSYSSGNNYSSSVSSSAATSSIPVATYKHQVAVAVVLDGSLCDVSPILETFRNKKVPAVALSGISAQTIEKFFNSGENMSPVPVSARFLLLGRISSGYKDNGLSGMSFNGDATLRFCLVSNESGQGEDCSQVDGKDIGFTPQEARAKAARKAILALASKI